MKRYLSVCPFCCWHSFRLTRERRVTWSWLVCSPYEPLLFSRQRSPSGRVSFLSRFYSAASLSAFLLNFSDRTLSLIWNFTVLFFFPHKVSHLYLIIVRFGTCLTYPVFTGHVRWLLNCYFQWVFYYDSFVCGANGWCIDLLILFVEGTWILI